MRLYIYPGSKFVLITPTLDDICRKGLEKKPFYAIYFRPVVYNEIFYHISGRKSCDCHHDFTFFHRSFDIGVTPGLSIWKAENDGWKFLVPEIRPTSFKWMETTTASTSKTFPEFCARLFLSFCIEDEIPLSECRNSKGCFHFSQMVQYFFEHLEGWGNVENLVFSDLRCKPRIFRMLHDKKNAVDVWSEGFPAEGGSFCIFPCCYHFHRKDDLFEKLPVRQVLKMIRGSPGFFVSFGFFKARSRAPSCSYRPHHGNRNQKKPAGWGCALMEKLGRDFWARKTEMDLSIEIWWDFRWCPKTWSHGKLSKKWMRKISSTGSSNSVLCPSKKIC